MTDDLSVSRHETGVTRVFAINVPDGTDAPFGPKDDRRISDALGVDHLQHDHVEVVRVSDLQPIGLTGYLTEGFGLPAETLATHKSRLDALGGFVLLVGSPAFGGVDTTISPSADLTYIATLKEPAPQPSFEPISSDSATGTTTPAEMPRNESPGRRYSPGWLVVAGLALAALVVWLVM